MKRYKALFFDFDGTLMDTSEGVFNGGRYAMEKAGIQIPENADWRGFIGPPLHECFRLAFGVRDRKTQDLLCTYYREYYRKEGMFQAYFYDGILDVIGKLRRGGCRIGIASMKNTDLIVDMCSHFGVSNLFDAKCGLNPDESNTKADVLREGMKSLGVLPSETTLVGDTMVDVLGAQEAGCDCIRVGWGFGFSRGEEGTTDSPYDILKVAGYAL